MELQIIVLEDTQEYISYAPKKDIEAQDRRPFDLLVGTSCRVRGRPLSIWNPSHALCFSLDWTHTGHYQSKD